MQVIYLSIFTVLVTLGFHHFLREKSGFVLQLVANFLSVWHLVWNKLHMVSFLGDFHWKRPCYLWKWHWREQWDWARHYRPENQNNDLKKKNHSTELKWISILGDKCLINNIYIQYSHLIHYWYKNIDYYSFKLAIDKFCLFFCSNASLCWFHIVEYIHHLHLDRFPA